MFAIPSCNVILSSCGQYNVFIWRMQTSYSVEDVEDFLRHASDRGLMPAATATALGVAVRNVLGVLTPDERQNIGALDVPGAIRRFNNKRARDFSPSSLKEYGRRVERALTLFNSWREDPANFAIRTRSTAKTTEGKRSRIREAMTSSSQAETTSSPVATPLVSTNAGGYSSSIAIREGWVVTISNIPPDLTDMEADRVSRFVKFLGSTAT